jgi:NAD(P)-dependent dehydrogenase (short-subunit alcohol dehydrogenase family)
LTRDSAVKAQFDTNVFALLRLIRATLPGLRAQGNGTVVNFSSIGGLHSYPSNGIYCATKFAVEGLTQSLAAEIAPFGLSAVIVEPGYFRTSFLSSVAAGSNIAPALAAYEGTPAHQARAAFTQFNGKQRGNPKQGAARIWEYIADEGVLKGKKKLLRLPLGTDTGAVMKELAAELNETASHYAAVWESTDFKE